MPVRLKRYLKRRKSFNGKNCIRGEERDESWVVRNSGAAFDKVSFESYNVCSLVHDGIFL